MFDDRGIEELAAMLPQCSERSLFVGLHKATVTHHIGG
jgi:hypothetical protein